MKNKTGKQAAAKRRIADEILAQIGKSVFLVFGVVALATIIMVWFSITSARESELTLESNAATNQLVGYFEKYSREAEVLSLNPEIRDVLTETKAGDNILNAAKMDTVRENLQRIAAADTENVLAVWIADLDASVLTQSDGYTSGEGWDITGRAWYVCFEKGQVILTEPYIDSSTGGLILSAVAPVYDEAGNALGAAGIDISMSHIMDVMSGYKIGSRGYMLLLSATGTIIYHPDEQMMQ